MTTQTTMTRKELKVALRNLKEIEKTGIDLRVSTEKLQAEYDRITTPKTVEISTGKLCNNTYGVWIDGKYDYLTERQLIQLGCKHMIDDLKEKSNDVRVEIIEILNNDEMMIKLGQVEFEDQPRPTKTWEQWLNDALDNFNESRLIKECPKLIEKAYQLVG